VDARPTFIAHVQAAKLMEPRQRAFGNPARPPEATAMSSPAFGQLRLDPVAVEGVAVGLRIVAAVALDKVRLAPWATKLAAEGWIPSTSGKS